MTAAETHVIVGGGLAGAKAAETLRTEGFEGRVVLLGEEEVRPYERPPLSKQFLRGEKGFDDAAVHGEDFYDAQGIELRSGTVATGLHAGRREVTLGSGEILRYDRLLLATGAVPRRLSVPGSELAGIHYLRTVGDSEELRRQLTPSRQVVVVGTGWIGSEVAASARQLGAEVVMVDLASVPLERVLGTEIGGVFRDLHDAQGVRMRFGAGIARFEGAGRVEEVLLEDGTRLPAEVVVVGVGVAPRVELAEAAGLVLDDGVAVDEQLETSAAGIFAAGDVANALHPRYGTRIRLEHWSAALNQGPAAARNMLGKAEPYERTPYFFSDQYDLGMEYRGWAPTWDRVVVRGDLERREFLSFWMQGDQVKAAMNVNVWDAGEAIEELIASGRAVDPDDLANPEVSLAG